MAVQTDIDRRLAAVRSRIGDVAVRANRPADSIRLVGVSKGNGPEAIVAAIDAGLEDIGENRVQEAAAKFPEVWTATTRRARMHLVGHLQTNKVRAALDLFDVVESVDSVRLAERISTVASRSVPVLLEVQFARTPDRFGFDVEELDSAVDAIAKLPNVELAGLMTVAPLGLDEAGVRTVFRTLREQRDRLQDSHPAAHLELSMGMSDDFPIAIEEGASLIRIGRAIFGG